MQHLFLQERLTDNIAENLSGALEFLQLRAIANFAAVDVNYGRMIQEKLEKIKVNKAANQPAAACPHKKVYGRSNL